ncbi:MAG: 23S rRNA (adenine(2503)-C(2))-methyltransferase RlmN [bacterium]
MRFEQIEEYAVKKSWPYYRLSQIRTAVFRQGIYSWEEATELPAGVRRELAENFRILSFVPEKILVSRDSRAVKALLCLQDGLNIETVMLRRAIDQWSVCVSSQCGCPVRCIFCASGKNGLKRNLTAEEIADQVLFWNQHMRRQNPAGRISSVVYMGMGEPFLNYPAVSKSLRLLSDADFFGLGQRHISVSTAGHVPGMEKMARDFPQVNLALSLHAADDGLRSRLIPLNRTYPIARLGTALEKYLKTTNRKVFLEYALMAGVNDRPGDARRLADLIGGLKGGRLLHVNLIRCNPVAGGQLQTGESAARKFLEILAAMRVHCTIRKSLGEDIKGACGQLAGDSSE